MFPEDSDARAVVESCQDWPGLKVGCEGRRFWLTGSYLPYQRLVKTLGDWPHGTPLKCQVGHQSFVVYGAQS